VCVCGAATGRDWSADFVVITEALRAGSGVMP
jgi:hypothetical protein